MEYAEYVTLAISIAAAVNATVDTRKLGWVGSVIEALALAVGRGRNSR